LQSVSKWQHDKIDWSIKMPVFYFNLLPWQRTLRYQKRGPDRSSTNKYLSFGAKIAKIGLVDPEIIFHGAIIEKDLKREKLTQPKYIAQSAP